MYVIRRTDQGGGYVSKPGNISSYTFIVRRMKKYSTKAAAQADCCENETPVPIQYLTD